MDKTNQKQRQEQVVWFPGEQAWELWQISPGREPVLLEQAAETGRDFPRKIGADRILALPVSEVIALPLLSNAPDKPGLVSMAEMQAERSGVPEDVSAVGFEILAGAPPNTMLRVEAPLRRHAWSGSRLPDRVCSSASLITGEGNSIGVWKEVGKLVVGFWRNGTLVYFDCLSSSSAGAEAGAEIQRLLFQLNCQGIDLHPEAILLRTAGDPAALGTGAGIPCRQESRVIPTAESACHLNPAWMKEHRRRRKQSGARRKRIGAVAAMALGAVCVLVGTLAIESIRQKRLRDRISELSPLANRIENMREQWREVSVAVDRDATCLELLKQLQGIPGANGIRFSRVEIGKEGIKIEGESANPRAALQFLDEVAVAESLAEFGWSFDQPAIRGDGTATFEMEGVW
ncbi:MAG: hypothetical protein HKN23_11610 [Verrucomicrobiales bacterium]|nr:hypothetical protein [Verrucomicrobiales bacterium]